MEALTIDWDNASVSVTPRGLLEVEVALRSAPDADWTLLSGYVRALSGKGIVSAELNRSLVQLQIDADADVHAIKDALAAALDEAVKEAESDRRKRQEASAEIQARIDKAEESAAAVQARFRQPLD